MSYEILSTVLIWLPRIFLGVVFVAAVILRFQNQQNIEIVSPDVSPEDFVGGRSELRPKRRTCQMLVVAVVVFRLLYAAFLTASQYYIWAGDKFTSVFLDSPLSNTPLEIAKQLPWIFNNKLGYFIFYSWGRFWLNAILSVGVAWLFYLFLKLLKKYRERFFEEGETSLGFLTALLVGWPNFTVFIPLVFVSVIIISILRRIFYGELYTTLGAPFLLAAFLTLIWGGKILAILKLTVLII